jgi:putative restriction endonuclease
VSFNPHPTDASKELFKRIKVWKRGAERAPHKPLLLLYALGRCSRGEEREVSFREVDEQLSALLAEFGPQQESLHTEYPFWRLQNDGIWIVSGDEKIQTWEREKDQKRSELLRVNAAGGFPKPIYEALSQDRSLLMAIAKQILEDHFPSTPHDRILKAVGLGLY